MFALACMKMGNKNCEKEQCVARFVQPSTVGPRDWKVYMCCCNESLCNQDAPIFLNDTSEADPGEPGEPTAIFYYFYIFLRCVCLCFHMCVHQPLVRAHLLSFSVYVCVCMFRRLLRAGSLSLFLSLHLSVYFSVSDSGWPALLVVPVVLSSLLLILTVVLATLFLYRRHRHQQLQRKKLLRAGGGLEQDALLVENGDVAESSPALRPVDVAHLRFGPIVGQSIIVDLTVSLLPHLVLQLCSVFSAFSISSMVSIFLG